MAGEPIEGQILLLAGTKASVSAERLPDLVDVVQADLGGEIDDYRRRFERAYADGDLELFLVDDGHWDELGDRHEFEAREVDAVRRAHEEQFLRIGRREGRSEEFETALEIRDAVVIGT